MTYHPEIIAFYLPQFYPFKENDEWWGKGFTEWTNVGKAKPLFKGHQQPRVPTELGYYDLRMSEVREQQVLLAKEACVTAFCYWHYWFGNGKRLLADIFDEVLNSKKPDFPFCLGWANHSWYSKNWNADGSVSKKLLMEQTYPGLEDEKLHFDFLIKAFNDNRYLKVDNCPLLYIFDPLSLPQEYLKNFRLWTKEAGFKDLYLVANMQGTNYTKEEILAKGYNAVNPQRLAGAKPGGHSRWNIVVRQSYILIKKIKGFLNRKPPFIDDYAKNLNKLILESDCAEDVIPSILPQWDHTPRSGWNGTLFVNSKPKFFYKHVKDALNVIKNKKHPMLFLKSWNEWGEGNYMEPDLLNGRGYIEALKKAVNEKT